MIDTILLLYAIVAITILVGGLFLMASAARTMPEDKAWHPMVDGGPESKELKQYMRKVTKRVHPEMKDVEPGTLRAELEDEDEEDDDDDGDVIITRV